MLTIWKYPLEAGDNITIEVPRSAQLLSVQTQNGTPQLWALVDPSAKRVTRALRIHGTGHQVSEDVGQYVGTFQLHGGSLVFHLFDQGEV